jgi:hypothetical protein
MKSVLALIALGLTTLIFEEKARQVAGDAHEAYSELLAQANEAKRTLTEKVERQPVISLLLAGGLAYFVASLIPNRS